MSFPHLTPVFTRKIARIQINDAAKQLLQNKIDWSDREVADGQIYQAAIAVMTGDSRLWPWALYENVPNCLGWETTDLSQLMQAAVLFLAEAVRLERHCESSAVTDGQRYTHKKALNQIWKRAQDIREFVDGLSHTIDALQTGQFTNKALFLPHAANY